jgi:ABC-type transporter Mla MlaB component
VRAVSEGVDTTEPVVLVVMGHLTMADTARLCEELTARLTGASATAGATGGGATGATGAGEAICDVGGLVRPDLAAVNTLARLHLTARRLGFRIRVRGADRELRLLLDLVGLAVLAE